MAVGRTRWHNNVKRTATKNCLNFPRPRPLSSSLACKLGSAGSDESVVSTTPTSVSQSRVHAEPMLQVKLRSVIQKSYVEHLPEFEVALMTGMRQGEQFTREWNDVDLGAGTIRLQISKNGKCRFVRLNSRALASVRMLHGLSIGAGRVFFINKKPRWFTDAAREAGLLDFTWHDLRHTFASRLVMAGVDIRRVEELMGHKSITMTMRTHT